MEHSSIIASSNEHDKFAYGWDQFPLRMGFVSLSTFSCITLSVVALSLPFLFESKANANLYYVIKSEGKEEPSLQDKGGAIAIELPVRLVKGNNKN